MPVRGKGWYKRPYRLSWTDPNTGLLRKAAYHSKVSAEEHERMYRSHGYKDVILRVQRDDA